MNLYKSVFIRKCEECKGEIEFAYGEKAIECPHCGGVPPTFYSFKIKNHLDCTDCKHIYTNGLMYPSGRCLKNNNEPCGLGEYCDDYELRNGVK